MLSIAVEETVDESEVLVSSADYRRQLTTYTHDWKYGTLQRGIPSNCLRCANTLPEVVSTYVRFGNLSGQHRANPTELRIRIPRRLLLSH